MHAVEQFEHAQRRLLDRTGVRAESRFIDVPAVSGAVHVLVCGEGPPVVMVPGMGDPAAMWAPLMARLYGFTLYAVDRPSFGLTGPPSAPAPPLRRLAIAFLEQVLEQLRVERPLFVANSMGSLWTIWLAIDRPARVGAMVHVGCPALILGTSAPLPMRLLAVRPIGRLLMALSPPSHRQVETFASMVGEDFTQLPYPEMKDLLVAAQNMPGMQAALRELLHTAVGLRGARPEVALTERELGRVQQPVQLIWGSRDAFGSPEVGRRAAAALPDAELHVLEDAGHVPWIASPQRVGDVAGPFLSAQAQRLRQ